MEEQAPESVRVKQGAEYLRASINHQGLKLDINTKNTSQSLSDIRRIVECITANDYDPIDDFTTFEMSTLLSEEFTANASAMAEMKRLIGLEQQYRVVKELLSAVEEIDLVQGKKSLCIEPGMIKRGIKSLVAAIDTQATRHALIHIKGLIPEHERLVIVDRIHEHIPHARIKAYQTEQDIEGKVLVEVLLFGDYEFDEAA